MREISQQRCMIKFTSNVPSFGLQCSLVTARREHFRLWLQLSRVTEVLKACLYSTTEGCLEDCSGMLACISVKNSVLGVKLCGLFVDHRR